MFIVVNMFLRKNHPRKFIYLYYAYDTPLKNAELVALYNNELLKKKCRGKNFIKKDSTIQ